MNETQKRIKAYKDALPGLRERVAGVALLLVMSLVMMTSASFAWLTLSKAPEVSSAATTVTANGNLEIALSSPEGENPAESQVGDSAKSQATTLANLTWGNLVNLSDPAYGLDSLTLRPAKLGNPGELLLRPLVTVNYGLDGRAEADYNNNLEFTQWDADEQRFAYSDEDSYGVRAISTVEYAIPDSVYNKYSALYQEYVKAINDSASVYQNEILTQSNIDMLADLISDYMIAEATAGSGTIDFTISASYMQTLCTMMEDLLRAYESAGEALADIINIKYFNYYGVDNYASHLITEAGLWMYNDDGSRKGANTALFTEITKPSGYDSYITDVPQLEACIETMRTYYNASTGKWSSAQWANLETTINVLAKIETCEVVLKDGTAINVRATSSLMSAKDTMEKDGVDAYIKNGLIVTFEALTGSYMNKSATIKASVAIVSITAKANRIMTYSHPSQNGLHYLTDAINSAYNIGNLGGENARTLAQDTYGMAVDLWVRTNAPESCLVLEGNVLTTSTEEPAELTLADGSTVALYSAVVTYEEVDEEGNPITDEVEVYYLDPNGTPDDASDDVAYFADTHRTVWFDVQVDENTWETRLSRGVSIAISSQQKINVITEVIGYEGENRVWTENEALSVNSTTQGSGSCYVFYANNPADQQNSLELLSNMQVAFLDEEGVLLAKARLNKERAYEESGRVTVPLELFIDTTTNNTVTTEDGRLGIVKLAQNEALRLTMIVYLEGSALTNQQVLAAGEIDGQLNIQFGSSTVLVAMGDDALEQEEVYVTATLEGDNEFNYGEGDATVDIVVNVEGAQPNTVTGFFIRQVNANQGSREQEMRFEPQGNGVWRATYTFDSPGTYVFRSVTLDGQEHTLDQSDYPTVVVNGFAVNSISCSAITEGNSAYVLTGNSSYTTPLTLKFSSSEADSTLNSVQLQFVNDETGSAVTTKMTYNATELVWKGNARFLSSGSYTLSYVILDGQYTELTAYRYHLQLVLGVKAQVDDDQTNRQYIYEGKSFDVKLEVKLFCDGGKTELRNIGQVELNYGKAGATTGGLYAALTWDGESYVGDFQLAESGIFSFKDVTITIDGTESEITGTTTAAPVYTVSPPDPPEYKGQNTAPYQLAGKTAVDFEVLLSNADGMGDGDVSAVITSVERDGMTDRSSVVTQLVEGVRASDVTVDGVTYNSFTFAIPSDTTYGQDGKWQLTELQCSNVYDISTGSYFTKENPMVIDVSGEAIVTEVQSVELSVSGTPQQLEGAFGSTVDVNNTISITVKDKLGNPLSTANADITSIVPTYAWEASSDVGYKTKNGFTYGAGYTSRSDTGFTVASFTIPMEEGAANGAFTQDRAVTLSVAGYYYCSGIDVTIAGTVYHYDAAKNTVGGAVNFENSAYVSAMPINAFKTTAPSVAITSPAGNANAATVNIVDSSQSGTCSTTYNYTAPGVGITLSGVCTGATATLNFTTSNSDGIVRLYGSATGANRVDGYSWSSNTTQTLYVGFAGGNNTSENNYVAAGTLTPTANGLVVTYNSVSYYFAADITIVGNGPA